MTGKRSLASLVAAAKAPLGRVRQVEQALAVERAAEEREAEQTRPTRAERRRKAREDKR